MGKVLFYPFLVGVGHLGISLSISKKILEKYGDKHEIYFIVNQDFADKLAHQYPKIKLVILKEEFKEKKDKDFLNKFGELWRLKDRSELVVKSSNGFFNAFDSKKKTYEEITEIIKRIKPDIFLYDHVMTTPIGIDQNIPYCCIISAAPTVLGHPHLPPHQSDLPTNFNEENSKKWKEFIDKAYLCDDFKKVKQMQNDWLREKKCETVDSYFLLGPSPYFNVYNYPTVVDYFDDKIKLPGNWFKLESSITQPLPSPFKIPEKLAKLDGKLIYISMGSFSSSYKPLMDHLINLISQLPYRFVLSAGTHFEDFNLSENIHGEKFVNQLAVLQSVDLMISHGGNNSFTECFYFGVPQIILPLCGDQINNATRIKDKGLGETFSPFECTKEDLSNAIEKLTTNEMKQKYKQISTKIQQDKSIDKICEKIVSYCK